MTARKPKIKSVQESIDAMREAETATDVVSEAKPAERITAESVAWDIAESYNVAKADGNRLTVTFSGPNGLVQTFHATVEEGIREF